MAFNPFVRWGLLMVLFGAVAVSSDSLEQRVSTLEEQIRDLARKVDRNYESLQMDLAKKRDTRSEQEEPKEPSEPAAAESSGEQELFFPDDSCRKVNDALICGSESFGSGWIVVQQRFNGKVNFNRNWAEYRNGFGEVAEGKDFWWGLEKVHQRTKSGKYELLIRLMGFNGEVRHIRHSEFVIADEKEKYKLKTLRGYSGDGGNVNYIEPESLILGQKFSTKDSDNDSSARIQCADTSGGGWWWNDCGRSLNAVWGPLVIWPAWKQSLLATRIMIRER